MLRFPLAVCLPIILVEALPQRQDGGTGLLRAEAQRKATMTIGADGMLIKAPSCGPRKVYIDFGANWGNTLRLYKDLPNDFPDGPWEVYAFEASPLIQPYDEAFVSWLNEDGPKPQLRVPPSGSIVALAEYANRYGCGGLRSNDRMLECMWNRFKEPLEALEPDHTLLQDNVIAARLAAAGKTLGPDDRDRFVLIPAAAGARNGSIALGLMTPKQMIHGGGVDYAVNPRMTVPLIDVVSWLRSNFRHDDCLVAKMDIEGGEFPILSALLDAGHGDLLDTLALECHSRAGDCSQLHARLQKETGIKLLSEGADYPGWDSYSAPDVYYPADPRTLVQSMPAEEREVLHDLRLGA